MKLIAIFLRCDNIDFWFVSFCPRMFNYNGEEVKQRKFQTVGNYTSALAEGSLNLFGDRVIKLGTNM